MMMCPDAEPDDGLFDVLLIGDVTKRDLLFVLPKTYRGKHLPHPRLEVLRGRVVTVDADEPLPIEIDGEQPGTTPARFEIVPKALPALEGSRSELGGLVRLGLAGRRRAARGRLRLLQGCELLLELRDPRLEGVDPADLLREVVDPATEVVDRGERLLAARKLGDPLQRLLTGIREAGDEVLVRSRLGLWSSSAWAVIPLRRVVSKASTAADIDTNRTT